MNQEKRILVIGDRVEAPYHSLNGVEQEFQRILGNEYQIEFTEQYMSLRLGDLRSYHMVLSYTDCWNKPVTVDLAAALTTYVTNGGSLLVIHNGISIQSRYELAQLIGAKFVSHPERCSLVYTNFHPNHPIVKEMVEFELLEEPYQFQFDSFSEKEVLFYYHYEDKQIPAAWALYYGYGKVVYLSPGHEAEIFTNNTYEQIIQNSATWLLL